MNMMPREWGIVARTLRSIFSVTMLAWVSSAGAATDWSAQDYDLYSGDFNGDGKTDILYVARDAGKPSGIAASSIGGLNTIWQTWSGNYLGIQWYGNAYTVLVGD